MLDDKSEEVTKARGIQVSSHQQPEGGIQLSGRVKVSGDSPPTSASLKATGGICSGSSRVNEEPGRQPCIQQAEIKFIQEKETPR